MSQSIDDILEAATPREAIVWLSLRGDLVAEWEDLEAKLETAPRTAENLGEVSPALAIAQRMNELRDLMLESQVGFRLRALSSEAWSDLHVDYPAMPTVGDEGTDDEKAKAWDKDKKKYRADVAAWFVRLTAATCYDPVMTVAQAGKLSKKLSHAQWRDLTDKVWEINTGSADIPFSEAASELHLLTGQK